MRIVFSANRLTASLIAWGVVALYAPALFAQNTWEEIYDDDGIKVWRRDVPGSSFVAFRGKGLIKAAILDVAAVVRDSDREAEWMENCTAAHTIEWKSAKDAVLYHRVESPAPLVSDRDTVLFTTTKIEAATKTIVVTFKNVDHTRGRLVDGVVRMPKLEGHWRIRYVDEGTTEVEYQVEADPGGLLPGWLVNLASKKLPWYTLQGLRKQVKAPGYDMHRRILEVAIDWNELGVKLASASNAAAQEAPSAQP